MSVLHFVGGRKGGTGKSFITKTLAEYHRFKKIAFAIAECDRVNPDVGRIYRRILVEIIFAYFTEDERRSSKADVLFAKSLEVPVLANLPAQVHEAMKAWLEDGGLYELAQQEGIQFVHWYVSNGGFDSVKLLPKTVKGLGPGMSHVFVRNWGLCDDWRHVDADEEFQSTIKTHRIPVIDLPKCPYLERNFIEAHQLTFLEAETHPELSVVSRQRIRNFLRKAFAEFERTGYV
jgi:hypothetical protein